MERNGKQRLVWLAVLAALMLVLGACDKGGEGEGTGEAAEEEGGGTAEESGGGAAATGGDPFSLSPGFAEMTLSGRSGGTTDASSHGPDCLGSIANTPDHAMTVSGGAVTALITATSEADTTLVILGPGGPFCNDDHDGLNPGVQATFAAGEYQVFVGNYSSDEGATAYTLTVAPAEAPATTAPMGGEPPMPGMGGQPPMPGMGGPPASPGAPTTAPSGP